MKLEVIWQNPEPLITFKQDVRRIRDDQSGVVYLVTSVESIQEFTLIPGAVA